MIALSPGASWLVMGGIVLFSLILGLALARAAAKPWPYAPESLSSPVRPREESVATFPNDSSPPPPLDLDVPPKRARITGLDPRVIDITDRIGRGRL
jgi:hypothetical protein